MITKVAAFAGVPMVLFCIIACNGEATEKDSAIREPVNIPVPKKERKVSKVTYYLENSESMFGYVSSRSEYVGVVAELADKPEFVSEKTPKEFNLINGGAPQITTLGNNSSVLKDRISREGFKAGDITRSNLNAMFQIALEKAGEDNISILISDCIYDIGQKGANNNNIEIEGKETRSRFIQRLGKGNVQTIVVKLSSKFDGDYFFSTKPGKTRIKQQRPYYLFIFGESSLLNKYFPEAYVKKLAGYVAMSRFYKIEGLPIRHQAISNNRKGTFKFDREVKNKLIEAEPDRNGQGFQVSVAADFSELPFPEQYLLDAGNYSASGGYKVVKVTTPQAQTYGVNFVPTHWVTVHTAKSPYGTLQISLDYVPPRWIHDASIDHEDTIDSSHTIGFKYLTEAILGAYNYTNNAKNIATLKLEINN